VRFTVSIGVASTGGGHQTLDELTRHADGALYQAKAAGRNTVVVADAPPTVGEPG
jgi:diguanylate cyclase (GGDEF)-like protein